MLVNQDEPLSLTFNTYDPDTGASKSANELPSVVVYDAAGVDTTELVTVAEIVTGLYRATFTASAANFPTIGKEYIVVAEASVTGSGAGATEITAKATIGHFQLSGVNHGKDLVNSLDGRTPREVLAIIASVIAGKIDDADTNEENFRDLDDTLDRVKVAVDPSGNRSIVTFDLTDLT